MKKIENNKLKRESGITLIALIITIIVLLILAGISLANTFSDVGIVEKLHDSKQQNEIVEEKEILDLAILKVIRIEGELSSQSVQNLSSAIQYYLEANHTVNKYDGNINVAHSSEEKIFTIIFPSGRNYTVNEYGNITYNESQN